MPDRSDLFGHVGSEAFGELPRATTEEKVMNLAIIEAMRSIRSGQDNVGKQVGNIATTVHNIELQMVRFEGVKAQLDEMKSTMNRRFGEIDSEIEDLKEEKHRRDGHTDVRNWFKPAFPWLAAAAAFAWAIAERLPPG